MLLVDLINHEMHEMDWGFAFFVHFVVLHGDHRSTLSRRRRRPNDALGIFAVFIPFAASRGAFPVGMCRISHR
jgi:hypothetical protein